MTVEEGDVGGWPGLLLAGDRIRVGVVPCPGGRVLSLCHDGEELLFVQPEHRGARVDLSGDPTVVKESLGFRVWGGNKTWVAPQSSWLAGTPPIDLDAAEYGVTLDGDSIVLASPVCRETGLQVTRHVHIEPDDTVVIEHGFSRPDPTRGLWSVTQWLRPFEVHFLGEPRAYPDEGTTEALMRAHVSRGQEWTRVSARDPVQLKVGTRAQRGEVVGLRSSAGDTLIVRHRFDTEPDARYAHDASVEVFNSEDYPYLEIEIHAPLGATELTERIGVERRPGNVDIRAACGSL